MLREWCACTRESLVRGRKGSKRSKRAHFRPLARAHSVLALDGVERPAKNSVPIDKRESILLDVDRQRESAPDKRMSVTAVFSGRLH